MKIVARGSRLLMNNSGKACAISSAAYWQPRRCSVPSGAPPTVKQELAVARCLTQWPEDTVVAKFRDVQDVVVASTSVGAGLYALGLSATRRCAQMGGFPTTRRGGHRREYYSRRVELFVDVLAGPITMKEHLRSCRSH